MASEIKLKPLAPSTEYKCTVEECDVEDRIALDKYRAKREEWLRWYDLGSDEPNSIQRQIFSMIFLDLAYRILAGPRATNETSGTATQNGFLAHFMDQGYVATQILAIRRLLDKRGDVISIRRLLNDISENKNLVTREIYVSYNGLPYDPNSWQSSHQEDDPMIMMWGIEAPGLNNYLASNERHKVFDRLSGVPAGVRKRSDQISDKIFEKLTQWLDTSPAETLITLSHKFFAHAADKASLDSLQYSGVSLNDIAAAQKAIVRVERAITDEILFVGIARGVVPSPVLGFYKGLDSPFASSASTEKMYSHWQELAGERNSWLKGIADELTA